MHEREAFHPKWYPGAGHDCAISEEPEAEETDQLLTPQGTPDRPNPLSDDPRYEDEPEWMWHRKTLDTELETALEEEHRRQWGKEHSLDWKCFDEWDLYRGESLFDIFHDVHGNMNANYGSVKGLLRILPQNTAAIAKVEAEPIQFRISEQELTKSASTPVTIRLYVIRGLRLESDTFNGLPDSYLHVSLDGGNDIKRKDHVCKENSNPYCVSLL